MSLDEKGCIVFLVPPSLYIGTVESRRCFVASVLQYYDCFVGCLINFTQHGIAISEHILRNDKIYIKLDFEATSSLKQNPETIPMVCLVWLRSER